MDCMETTSIIKRFATSQQIKHVLNLLRALQYSSEVLGPKFTRKAR